MVFFFEASALFIKVTEKKLSILTLFIQKKTLILQLFNLFFFASIFHLHWVFIIFYNNYYIYSNYLLIYINKYINIYMYIFINQPIHTKFINACDNICINCDFAILFFLRRWLGEKMTRRGKWKKSHIIVFF